MRAAMRNGTDPTVKINWMGFRCARDARDAQPQVSQLGTGRISRP